MSHCVARRSAGFTGQQWRWPSGATHGLLCCAAVCRPHTMTRPIPMTRLCRSLLAGVALAVAPSCAFAHDTWLHVADQQPGSGLLGLEMGSGSRYPKSEGAVPGSRLVSPG